ncbi:hypothetical protein TSMEX_005900 [Taenia solium]|eukprot:TsM_000324700 transcript=TsM_000324700 gene=TsM_000324700
MDIQMNAIVGKNVEDACSQRKVGVRVGVGFKWQMNFRLHFIDSDDGCLPASGGVYWFMHLLHVLHKCWPSCHTSHQDVESCASPRKRCICIN